jgi:hypothetical protein
VVGGWVSCPLAASLAAVSRVLGTQVSRPSTALQRESAGQFPAQGKSTQTPEASSHLIPVRHAAQQPPVVAR